MAKPEKKRGMVATASMKAGSVATRFLARFATWTAIIAVLACTVSAALWSQVYDRFGLPLSIGKESVYQAVLFGGRSVRHGRRGRRPRRDALEALRASWTAENENENENEHTPPSGGSASSW